MLTKNSFSLTSFFYFLSYKTLKITKTIFTQIFLPKQTEH